MPTDYNNSKGDMLLPLHLFL